MVADPSLEKPLDQEIGMIQITFKNTKNPAMASDSYVEKKEEIIPTLVETSKANFFVRKF